MIANILIAITHFVTSTIDHMGYVGVALLMAIESAAIPLPSEIIMPFSGFLVGSGRFTLLNLALAGAVGSTIGSLVTYYIGYYGGPILMGKYEKIVRVSSSELGMTEKFFNRYKTAATFFGRVLPIIRTFISIPAGIARVPIIPFTIYAFVGSFIWSFFLAWLGFRLGGDWHKLEGYFRKFDIVIVILLGSVFLYWLYNHLKKPKVRSS